MGKMPETKCLNFGFREIMHAYDTVHSINVRDRIPHETEADRLIRNFAAYMRFLVVSDVVAALVVVAQNQIKYRKYKNYTQKMENKKK